MTSPTTKRQRLLTSDRLYTAAIIWGLMLIPHLAVGTAGGWPAQPFTAHAFSVLFLVGLGWRLSDAETRRGRTAAARDDLATIDNLEWRLEQTDD